MTPQTTQAMTMIANDIADAMERMVEKAGRLSGSRADASSPQAVSTKGFDPGRKEGGNS